MCRKNFQSPHFNIKYYYKIALQPMVDHLLFDTEVISMYNCLIENSTLPIDFEVKNNLLENMLKFYLCVRSFYFARDVVGNHLYASRKVKTKALRKDIKKQQINQALIINKSLSSNNLQECMGSFKK